ncbi:2-oxo acid dehydrogenase subunit E2 [Legionella pneumophila serogroup 1]|uniref:dihydrolipoamide acetyltransferase family protein n=1 Tax=Legionella pneumophila TaxID=446 RepID=UPI00077075DD|nr:dihydrolipoamide acetyltransferase family protein [Legionella pneumophila]HAT8944463.1 2-oxo acid dehydrogenase subunit E2 [Legionella pneumophila subsp. pneumophila]MCH9059412.1 2-oxo acid dehydrogenase subunit E2 [Legionella pneumophila serogroup 1]MCH9062005.1 2-oxo acid dehydrogenase subunit E2 [Legionella pneumophila serogroup 1]MCH9066334.1 2-oxo acid dehydrogenase subunit E2 [Legionella pneumophila serogroup 1]MCH9068078.1 2-oxo acid dehydrogenase subunit E2 [Legionella pneumophila s
MNIFNLPDLGEGLPDAEIHEWFVKEGDTVKADQPLVSMETAKAVVDVPCPQSGTIAKLYGKPGDVIKTGEPLVAFVSTTEKPADKGTVVGNLEESTDVSEDNFIIGSQRSSHRVKTTPAVRVLAKKLGVDLSSLKGSGDNGVITREDVQNQANINSQPPAGFEPLRGVRRAMLNSMVQSHAEIVPVSIFDEADIHIWKPNTDITVRLIRAIIHASKKEPALNAWFDTKHAARRCFKEVHLGIAMDNEEGLFVPVIHDAEKYSDSELRKIIDEFKESVRNRAVSADKLKGATITLSNFGKFSGRFASPIIVPPMVAILAVGRLYKAAVINDEDKIEAHKMLPLSLSFDHRAITGGEATRFLGAVIESLQQA